MAPAGDEEMAKTLARFDRRAEGFNWRMRPLRESGSFVVHALEFPSPYVSPVEGNNRVHCEYFLSGAEGRRPAVIVLHILDGSFTVARIICQSLSGQGIHALMLKMPYYGERRPADEARLRKMTDNPEILVDGVTQAIMDVRRAARWLGTRAEVEPNRIGLCGVSLGGFVAASAAGVDGHFPRVAVVLAGGDLAGLLMGQAKEVTKIRRYIEEGQWTLPRLKELLHPIDPLTYASRLKAADVLMINALDDKVVPPASARKLASASGARIRWYKASHYSMVLFLPAALKELSRHFSEANWPVPAGRQ